MGRQFEIYPNPTVRKTPKKSLSNARNARPILPLKKRPNISLQNEQKYCQEMVFSLKKNKKESFLPPLKTKQKFPLSNRTKKQNFALFCSCEFVLEINNTRRKNEKISEGGT